MSKITQRAEVVRTVKEAIRYHDNILPVEYYQYAPIYNSHSMLLEILDLIAFPAKLKRRYNSGHLMIGLLASKALDGDDTFTDYAHLLHQASGAIDDFVNGP